MDLCKPAIDQGFLKMLSIPDDMGLGQRNGDEIAFFVGSPSTPENNLEPEFIYQAYRSFAAQADVINAVGRSLDDVASLAQRHADTLAPKGLDEWTALEVPGLNLDNVYQGFSASQEEREIIARLCLGRLGAVVKSLGTCSVLDLQPYTSDPGIASSVQKIDELANRFIMGQDASTEDKRFQECLARLHRLIVAKYLDDTSLDEMSLTDVLRMRSKSWGRARENRVRLEVSLRDMAIETETPNDFEQVAEREIKEYLKATEDWRHEAFKLKVKFMCALGSLSLGSAAGTSELVEKVTGLAAWQIIMFFGAFGLNIAKEELANVFDVIRQRDDTHRLAGYALTRPYGNFFK